LSKFTGISLVVLVAVFLTGCAAASSQAVLNLTIVHTTNIEGQFDPCSCLSTPAGGVARESTALMGLRNSQPGLFLVDGGDALFGTPIADINRGLAGVAVMNALGYDAAALGDRDFIYGPELLLKAIAQARFPFLSANVVSPDTLQPVTQGSVVVNKNGVRIAFIGLTSPALQTIISADMRLQTQIKVLDPIETAQRLVPELRKQSDAVIILSHLGENLDRKLAETVEGITAIIGGHSRQEISPPKILAGGVAFAQVGYQNDVLGVLRLGVGSDGKAIQPGSENMKLDASIASDPKMVALVTHYKALAVLNGNLLLSIGMSASLPLDVHRSTAEIQRAYLAAIAFPEVIAREPAPAGLAQDGKPHTLLSCFINNGTDVDFQFDYSMEGLQQQACVQKANEVLGKIPLSSAPIRLIQDYWSSDD
jgi:2',3'-cyclic-nucleotide 2'-phosphodiesterase (5'-nucleotidase family)